MAVCRGPFFQGPEVRARSAILHMIDDAAIAFATDFEYSRVPTLARDRDNTVVQMRMKILKVANWLIVFGLVIATIVPAGERPVTNLQHDIEHLLTFGLTGTVFGFNYPRQLGASLFIAVVFALVLELSQIPLETRHARLEDFLVDAMAGCLGILIAYGCRKLNETWPIKTIRKEARQPK